ncbi:hypothetical protein [Streptomyces sp. TS71-3]|uniref:hypothetical protein n=1 Tax=Streptomyces sp. TS71-3 TaxID=2733862 RepID=UPI001B2BE7F4|nr:hypothetical protein [Streptomyces sp. TS71-3]GHJ34787.1 hypothetical protein Sm713_03960 [Streptomyces sp. TS71-3]
MGRDNDHEGAAELDLARHLVARLAPEELPLFEETAAAVARGGRGGRRRDDPLGFGAVDAATVLFTGVAYGVATEVFKDLVQAAGQRATGRALGWLRRLRRPRPQAAPDAGNPYESVLTPLPPDVLEDVHGTARRRAILLGLPEDRAGVLADTVVAYLRERTARRG